MGKGFLKRIDPPMLWFVAIILLLMMTTHQRNAVYRDEITLWSTALRQSPGKARLHYVLGRALIASGRYEEALREMGSAEVQHDVGNLSFAHLYSGLAVALLELKDYDGAFRAAARALVFDIRSAQSWNALGEVSFARGDYERAAAYFQEAMKYSPGDAAVIWNAATALEKAGHYERARQIAQKIANEAEDERSRSDARELLKQLDREMHEKERAPVRSGRSAADGSDHYRHDIIMKIPVDTGR